jgi:hypothetical protein
MYQRARIFVWGEWSSPEGRHDPSVERNLHADRTEMLPVHLAEHADRHDHFELSLRVPNSCEHERRYPVAVAR